MPPLAMTRGLELRYYSLVDSKYVHIAVDQSIAEYDPPNTTYVIKGPGPWEFGGVIRRSRRRRRARERWVDRSGQRLVRNNTIRGGNIHTETVDNGSDWSDRVRDRR